MKWAIDDIFYKIADKAREDGRAPPVIETDLESAKIIADALVSALGCRPQDLVQGWPLDWPHVVQFDGVKVVARRIPERDLYREHFGPLADIWE